MRKKDVVTLERLEFAVRESLMAVRKDRARVVRLAASSNLSKGEIAWLADASALMKKGGDEYLDYKLPPRKRTSFKDYKSKVKRKAVASMLDLHRIVSVGDLYDDAAWDEMFLPTIVFAFVSALVDRGGIETAQVINSAVEFGMKSWARKEIAPEIADALELQMPIQFRYKSEVLGQLWTKVLTDAAEGLPQPDQVAKV